MTRSQEKMVKDVLGMQQGMNEMTVDRVSELSPEAQETEMKISLKQTAMKEGIQYIEPKRKLQPFGKLPEKLKKDHERDWEYVKGIFENEISKGEPITFWFSKYPGDADCLWEVPSNKPVYVPRMVANLLSGEKDQTNIQTMVYHSFNYIEKPVTVWKQDDFTHQFAPTGTYYRGKFRAIGAFA